LVAGSLLLRGRFNVGVGINLGSVVSDLVMAVGELGVDVEVDVGKLFEVLTEVRDAGLVLCLVFLHKHGLVEMESHSYYQAARHKRALPRELGLAHLAHAQTKILFGRICVLLCLFIVFVCLGTIRVQATPNRFDWRAYLGELLLVAGALRDRLCSLLRRLARGIRGLARLFRST